METTKLLGLLLVSSLALSACKKHKTETVDTEVTSSGHEIGKPVDDSVVEKSNVDPPPPEVR
ncbi:MAG: hypothetical protein JWN04_5823 [Myxococcaceae bacterium]|nr:hypothetical protein [Myxococcaceae bacterium]